MPSFSTIKKHSIGQFITYRGKKMIVTKIEKISGGYGITAKISNPDIPVPERLKGTKFETNWHKFSDAQKLSLSKKPKGKSKYNYIPKRQRMGEDITRLEKEEAIHKAKKISNPIELLKQGEWTPAHAIRIRKGRLEIMR